LVSKNTIFIFSILIVVLSLSIPHVDALEPIWTYSTTGNKIGGVTVSSDGSAIAVGAEKVLLFSNYGELLAKEPYGEQVLFTQNGVFLISSFGPSVYFFQRNTTNSTFQKKWDYELPDRVRSIDISEDGKIIAAAGEAGGTYVFSNSGKMTGSNSNYSAIIRVSPNGQRILGVSVAGLYRYSSSGSRSRYENISVVSQPDVMELTGTGTSVVYNDDQSLLCVNIANGAELWKTRATADITALAMVPAGTKILIGTQNGNLDLFDDKGNRSWSYTTNPANTSGERIRDVALSSDGKIAVAGTYYGKIVALDAAGNELWSNMTKDHINHIAMSADGSLVVATGEETVYAFSSSAKHLPTAMTSRVTGSIVQQKNTTSVPVTTAPQKTVETSRSATQEITSVPTTYSVIRTSTQSPVSELIPLMGIGVVLMSLVRKR
jgi:outer membrane protein assembly factor BamB